MISFMYPQNEIGKDMKTQKHKLAPNGDRFIEAILFMMGSLAIGLVEPSVLFIIDTHLTD